MPSNLTKDAILTAMRIVEAEGDHDAWLVLDGLFSAIVAGRTASLAEAVAEWDADQEDATVPAWAEADDGRRGG